MRERLSLVVAIMLTITSWAQHVHFNDAVAAAGFSIVETKNNNITINYSVVDFTFENREVKGESFDFVSLPGVFLPGEAGSPDLPSESRYIAIPEGATISYSIKEKNSEVYTSKNIAPANAIPFDIEETKQEWVKSKKVYTKNAFYPASPVTISPITNIRGVNVVQIGVSPFQYNPVSQELKVSRDLEIVIEISGGKKSIGDDRLRNAWFEPILQDALLNYSALPTISNPPRNTKSSTGCEYLIVIPNDPNWLQYAQQLQQFRNEQGIETGIVTLAEIGANTPLAIEAYIDNAYNNWDEPPVAVLLMADYGSDSENRITSYELDHPYSGTYISDNLFADVTGNSLPDIIFARMAAEDTAQLGVMVSKVIEYETNPPTDPAFYSSPVTALGWQTERWFQICSEVIGGYFQDIGKTPIRINEIYSGTPGTVWSTATNTATVVDYFGPDGLGYLTATPEELGNWSGGDATQISAAINTGSFMVVHRDHGGETLWGEPSYSVTHINALTNTELPFVFSLNCLTGKFNRSGVSFAEAFHRHTNNGNNSGALGLIAASQVSYSFVNDVFAWGMFDNFFPDFMPEYGMTQVAEHGIFPAFGNASGKYFLQQSSWPYNSYNKEITYNLFHHHGDAFSVVYSEVPQTLTVTHNSTILSSANSFDVIAPEGSLIGLSVNGTTIGSAYATGGATTIQIDPQNPQQQLLVTITKQNYLRYQQTVDIVAPAGGCVMYNLHTINDASANGNGIAEYGENLNLNITVENIGDNLSENVSLLLQTTDSFVTISQDSAFAGTLNANATVQLDNAFSVAIAENTPDNHASAMLLIAQDAYGNSWNSTFNLNIKSGELQMQSWDLTDTSGDGLLDPGESATLNVFVLNNGGAATTNVSGMITTNDPYLTINTSGAETFGDIASGAVVAATYEIVASPNTPAGHNAQITFNASADLGLSLQEDLDLYIGKIAALILDLDPMPSSGSIIQTTIQDLGFNTNYSTIFPEDLNLYRSIFVCLGMYSDNTTLTNTQGQVLADYLNNGGNLYMEGGDTWAFDEATAVHGMFNINGITDGNGDLSTLVGVENTFTSGMQLEYTGINNYVDQLEAINDGFAILSNNVINYTCAVANEGINYKTIGASFEFGGLTGGSTSSSDLMLEYLTFFGIIEGSLPPQVTIDPVSIDSQLDKCETETISIGLSNTGESILSCTIEPPAASWLSVSSSTISVQPGATEYFDVIISAEGLEQDIYNGSILLFTNDPVTSQILVPVELQVADPMMCPRNMITCENDLPFELSGGYPEDGTFSGPFVTNNIFDPTAAGSGDHIITYSVTSGTGTCTLECSFMISVIEAPIVICPQDIAMCGTLESIVLTGATPIGGTYSGSGITDSIFDPAIAGYGIHEISYSYTNEETGCYDISSFYITVDSLQEVSGPGRIHVCSEDPIFALYGGIPEGGVYVFQNDTITTFDPSVGSGNYRIKYIYNGVGGCGGSCRFVITVHPTPSTPQNTGITNTDEFYFTLSWGTSVNTKKYYVYYKPDYATDWDMLITKNTSVTLDGLEAGTTYQTMVQAINKFCVSEMSDTLTTTTLPEPTYCSSGGLDSSNEWIDYVRFSPVKKYSGDDDGYADNTGLGAGNITAGKSSKVFFSNSYNGSRRYMNWSVWIDYNRDGIFSDQEQIADVVSKSRSTLKQLFFVPLDAHIGITRARVSLKNGGEPEACELYDLGETEDYLINIRPSANGDPDAAISIGESESVISSVASLFCVPNPASDQVLIYYGDEVINGTLNLYSITGTLIQTSIVSGIEYIINVDDFIPGVYIIELNTGSSIVTSKLIVK